MVNLFQNLFGELRGLFFSTGVDVPGTPWSPLRCSLDHWHFLLLWSHFCLLLSILYHSNVRHESLHPPFDLTLQSKPWIMFAATLQPSWPSRPKTNVTLLFYFLKLYNFCFKWIFCRINQFWATAPMDLKNHDGTKKIAKKGIFRLNLEVLLINRSLWNFTWSLQLSWI